MDTTLEEQITKKQEAYKQQWLSSGNSSDKLLYKKVETEYKNRINHKRFRTTTGLRPRTCLSPTLLKIYLNQVLKKWMRACNDQVVIAQDTEDLEFMARRLFREYEDWDLSVNRTKTQYLCVGSDK
ncbi:hypothetical protein HUJ04_001530, partial [Dendroctonus ponderosae]